MSENRPNILLVTTDQQHYSTLGKTNSRIKTPNLDRLCDQGVRFDRAYCPNPTCTPSRASILTGMYPSQHGAWSLGTKLSEDVPTVSGILSEAGYSTSLIGKAHFQPLASQPGAESIECMPKLRDLDFWRNFHGPWYGFDHVETCRNHTCEFIVGGHYAAWMEDRGLANWADYFEPWPLDENRTAEIRSKRAWDLPEEFHYTRWTAERTAARIEAAAAEGQPFFIWSSFHDPHAPFVVPEPWASMYDPADMMPGKLTPGEHDSNPPHFAKTQQDDPEYWANACTDEYLIHGAGDHRFDVEELKKDMAIYYGMVSFIDQQVGRILDALDQAGQVDNTLIVFTTDHGELLGQHGLCGKAIHMYEDVLRVPFIVRMPGNSASQTSDAIQNLVDLAPSFLEAAGLDSPGAMTGVSQLDTWAGGPPSRTWSVTENHHGTDCFHMRTYVNSRYKITVYHDSDDGELFDLVEDPGEVTNLWHKPEAAELKARLLLEFMQATLQLEPMPMPRIANA